MTANPQQAKVKKDHCRSEFETNIPISVCVRPACPWAYLVPPIPFVRLAKETVIPIDFTSFPPRPSRTVAKDAETVTTKTVTPQREKLKDADDVVVGGGAAAAATNGQASCDGWRHLFKVLYSGLCHCL